MIEYFEELRFPTFDLKMDIAHWFSFTLCLLVLNRVDSKYDPTWESLDSRPLPSWFDEAKFGIFLHWGVFSVPSFGTPPNDHSEWFWHFWEIERDKDTIAFMKNNYPPSFTYPDFAPQFHTEFFDPGHWTKVFEAAGAKYIVLTTKHHEGYTMWPSKYSWNWNAGDVGPKRDLVGELAESIKSSSKLHFGVYYSLYEWFNEMYLEDKASGFKTNHFITRKMIPALQELITTYKPDLIWSDGDWDADSQYWNSTEFLAWLYNDSPVKDTIVVNDRWGAGTWCKHGGYFNCHDHFSPGVLFNHKWENCFNMDRWSWGYRRNAQFSDIRSVWELISELSSTVSCGGNLLLNIGPTSDGMIDPIFEERLLQLGQWLTVNGEAIYSTRPWKYQKDTITPGIWYTSKGNGTAVSAYAIVLNWPDAGKLTLGAPTANAQSVVTMLGYPGEFKWSKHSSTGGIDIDVSNVSVNHLPCQWAWVFKLVGLA